MNSSKEGPVSSQSDRFSRLSALHNLASSFGSVRYAMRDVSHVSFDLDFGNVWSSRHGAHSYTSPVAVRPGWTPRLRGTRFGRSEKGQKNESVNYGAE